MMPTNEYIAFIMGLFFGMSLLAGAVYVDHIQPCEKNLPKDQHCKIIGVVDDQR